jgi:surface antigen
VAAVNNLVVVSGVEEEQSISGQDYSTSASEGDNRRKKTTEYYVKEGDALSTVASKFGIKMQTVLWANNLDALDVIRPGDKLAIPPEDGAMYRVEAGDTLLSVANRYDCDINEIVEYNQLDENMIVEGQLLFLPGGERPVPVSSSSLASSSSSDPSPDYSSSSSSSSSYLSSENSFSTPTVRYGGGSHRFPYGYCTWYVAQRRGGVPWGGNASAWLGNASAAGYATGSQPVAGAIMVTRESWWGHVAYVEGVSGNSVTVSEMNMRGWGIVSRRTISKNNWVVRGYIY